MGELLSGWGRTAPTASEVVHPVTAEELAAAAKGAGPRGAIARGLGRAYGDAAQDAGGRVVDATGVHGILDLDLATGVARLAAGTSIDALLREIVPRGWFVPVTPGTRFVTIGGAIASDIHGKNHHADGTFGAHVQSMVVAGADGVTRTLTPAGTPEEFWATCGGMGLTGTIVEATVALKPIGSSRLLVDTDRLGHLDDLLARLRADQERHRYSVAWIDTLATGANLGRSVLTSGDFATRSSFEAAGGKGDPLAYSPSNRIPFPPSPVGFITRLTTKAFNEVWFRKAPAHREAELQSIAWFFHPLDLVLQWNRVYGPRGFVQWQCVVPFDRDDVLRDCLESLAAVGAPSFLAVLKTLGAANPAPLSFPAPGWTLAIDVPAGSTALAEVLDRLDRRVVDAGGRLYLAKESRVHPDLVAAMYPRLDEWRAVRARMDPTATFRSDLARRLRLL